MAYDFPDLAALVLEGDRAAAQVLRAVRTLTPAAMRQLAALGVPGPVIAQGAMRWGLGVTMAAERDGRWTWAEDGARRLTLVVGEFGAAVDVVALSSEDRDSWSLLTGNATVLGLEAVYHAGICAAPDFKVRLHLHATPIDWLVAGCEGICVLRWCPETLGLLRGLGPHVELVVGDAGQAEWLRGQLAYGGLPRVGFAGVAGAHGTGRLAA